MLKIYCNTIRKNIYFRTNHFLVNTLKFNKVINSRLSNKNKFFF